MQGECCSLCTGCIVPVKRHFSPLGGCNHSAMHWTKLCLRLIFGLSVFARSGVGVRYERVQIVIIV